MKVNKSIVSDYLQIILGTALTAFAVAIFLTPAKLAPGGISGVATIIYHLTGISLGLLMMVLSIPIYIIGVLLFGRTYGIRTLIGTLLLSLFTMIFNMLLGYDGILDYSKDMSFWLSALYGGIISGLGIGFVMKAGSNTGGTDIIAQIISKYTQIPLGTSLMIVDGVIIAFSAFIFGIESALYSVFITVLVSIVIDRIISSMGTGYAKSVYIISEKLDEIGDFIIKKMDRSGTLIYSEGLFSKEKRKMLMVVIPNKDLTRITRFVHSVDAKAFLIVQDTVHVLGEGYKDITSISENSDVTQS